MKKLFLSLLAISAMCLSGCIPYYIPIPRFVPVKIHQVSERSNGAGLTFLNKSVRYDFTKIKNIKEYLLDRGAYCNQKSCTLFFYAVNTEHFFYYNIDLQEPFLIYPQSNWINFSSKDYFKHDHEKFHVLSKMEEIVQKKMSPETIETEIEFENENSDFKTFQEKFFSVFDHHTK